VSTLAVRPEGNTAAGTKGQYADGKSCNDG
jgi:hypothetical protein